MTVYETIQAKLSRGEPVLMDGPMNTELVRRGVRWRKHGMLTDLVPVENLHSEYLRCGVDVIRTNTFQLNRLTYLNVFRSPDHQAHIGAPGLSELMPHLLKTSVRLAKQARIKQVRQEQTAIAGVISPMQHCFRPDLAPDEATARKEHEFMTRLLADAGVDLILCESMNTIREAKGALAAGKAAGLPVWVSFTLGPEGELLSKESLAEAAKAMEAGGAAAVMVDNSPLADVGAAIPKLKAATSLPVGGMALIGRFSPPSWKFDFFPQFVDTDSCPPERYAADARNWRKAGASIFGGDHGTGPAHISALRTALTASSAAA